MRKPKKTDRRQNKDFLSVGPITSRDAIDPTHRKTNLLAAAKQQLKYLTRSIERKQEDAARLRAAINAMTRRPMKGATR